MTAFALYAGLFATAFLAATILPLQSEAALAGLLLTKSYPPWLLIAVASAGNILGSLINWLLGRKIESYQEKKWFPASPAQLERARNWYLRHGRWVLLLSWVPVFGDPITIAAGMLREKLHIFLALVTLAKAGRYIVLAAATLQWAG